jgi:uncharacterized membrane protein
MQSLLFHPKLVHLPMALAILMPLVAFGLWLAWRRGWLPARTWLVATALQAILVGSGVLSLRSGEAEEETVEGIVGEAAIEAHEEAAELFVWASGGVLALMGVAWALSSRRAGPTIALAASVGTLVVFVLGYRTGQAGGELVYRHGAAQAYVDGAATGGPSPMSIRDDDD